MQTPRCQTCRFSMPCLSNSNPQKRLEVYLYKLLSAFRFTVFLEQRCFGRPGVEAPDSARCCASLPRYSSALFIYLFIYFPSACVPLAGISTRWPLYWTLYDPKAGDWTFRLYWWSKNIIIYYWNPFYRSFFIFLFFPIYHCRGRFSSLLLV